MRPNSTHGFIFGIGFAQTVQGVARLLDPNWHMPTTPVVQLAVGVGFLVLGVSLARKKQ